jgi:S-formylglutathione hydrolase FrmB
MATKAFLDSLEALEVPHVYEVYAGDHRNRMRERMATRILPWIDAQLEH